MDLLHGRVKFLQLISVFWHLLVGECLCSVYVDDMRQSNRFRMNEYMPVCWIFMLSRPFLIALPLLLSFALHMCLPPPPFSSLLPICSLPHGSMNTNNNNNNEISDVLGKTVKINEA